jgi:predicted ester cyclase
MTPEEAIHEFLDIYNLRNWHKLKELVHPHLTFNEEEISLAQYKTILQDTKAAMSKCDMSMGAIVYDSAGERVATRFLVHGKLNKPYMGVQPSGEGFTYAKHALYHFRFGKISRVTELVDLDQLRRQTLIPPVAKPPVPADQATALSAQELKDFYMSYIGCINRGRETMRASLADFCQPHVQWSGRRLSLAAYRALMEETQDCVEGVRFEVGDDGLVVDAMRQRIAARIEFAGTPVKQFAGAEPNGKQVRFAEHAMYWLDGGKITRVETVIDWEAYRSQMAG